MGALAAFLRGGHSRRQRADYRVRVRLEVTVICIQRFITGLGVSPPLHQQTSGASAVVEVMLSFFLVCICPCLVWVLRHLL